MISIIIPTYNESSLIKQTLTHLIEITTPNEEVIIVDGFSEDDTKLIANGFTNIKIIDSPRGRAIQMNTGARFANGEFLLFLHADVTLDSKGLQMLRNEILGNNILWGWFEYRLDSPKFIYRIIELVSNFRNRVTGIPLGDHGIFVRKDIFSKIGGFPEISLMEDIEFSKKIKLIAKGLEIKSPIKISVRRFEKRGITLTIAKMWMIRALYYLGVKPKLLTKIYAHVR